MIRYIYHDYNQRSTGIYSAMTCHARSASTAGRKRLRGRAVGWQEPSRGDCRAARIYIPISIDVRGHFIVVTAAAPDFHGARPARRVFIGRHAVHGRRHVGRRRAQNNVLDTYIHGHGSVARPFAAPRCQGIHRVIHTWNINRSPARLLVALGWYTQPRHVSASLAFPLVLDRSPILTCAPARIITVRIPYIIIYIYIYI